MTTTSNHCDELRQVCFVDPRSGVHITQLTSLESIQHHPFFYVPAYDDAMRYLTCVSHATGSPQVCVIFREGSRVLLRRLTDGAGILPFSVHPSPDGRWVYFLNQTGGWRAATEGGRVEQLVSLDVGLSPASVTSVSRCGNWWAFVARGVDASHLMVVDLQRGNVETIHRARAIGHPEFCPYDPTLLRFAGPYDNRIWVIQRDGTRCRPVYQRDAAAKQWIVHESWRPQRGPEGQREIYTVDWPHGMLAIDIDSGRPRRIATFNAWHAVADRADSLIVSDTTFPDIGLQLFDPNNPDSRPTFLCSSQASNEGAHWGVGHCPYDDGPVQGAVRQHTHPHPSFSPDGRRIVFTSDRSGSAQVYEVSLPVAPPTNLKESSQ